MYNHLFEEVTISEKVEIINFMKEQEFEYYNPTTVSMISILNLNKSTYYNQLNQTVSKSQLTKERIKNEIYNLFYEYKSIYGSPKIHAELVKIHGTGYVSLRTVSNYMKQMSLKSIAHTSAKISKSSDIQLPFEIPMINYIKDDRPSKPGTHILTDITYIYTTTQGWMYLLSFMDMFTRKIIAWDLNDNMSAEWVTSITKIAYCYSNEIKFIHSDRGSQYTSKIYLSYLLSKSISPSFSAKGYPYHNAWIESFHAQLKKEVIYRVSLRDQAQAKLTCFKYIEGFYNTIRSQKSLYYLSPNEYERNYNNNESKIIKPINCKEKVQTSILLKSV